jgi:enoyl-[acyl-carrier protein] reductase II
MLASMCLGADGVQVGSRFAASIESSAHSNFKDKVVDTKEGDTMLTLKEIAPVRMIKNKFYYELASFTKEHNVEELKEYLGKRRLKKGMFEGDLSDGMLEIGQVAGIIHSIESSEDIIKDIISEFREVKKDITNLSF